MIRPATQADHPAIGALLLPIVRAGETYALPRDWDEAEIVAYWCAQPHHVFVHEDAGGRINGSFYIKANQMGGGVRQTVAAGVAQARLDSLTSLSCAQLAAGAATGYSSTRGVKESWTVTDGRNIKTIAVNIQIPRRTKTLVYSMVIPCRD